MPLQHINAFHLSKQSLLTLQTFLKNYKRTMKFTALIVISLFASVISAASIIAKRDDSCIENCQNQYMRLIKQCAQLPNQSQIDSCAEARYEQQTACIQTC